MITALLARARRRIVSGDEKCGGVPLFAGAEVGDLRPSMFVVEMMNLYKLRDFTDGASAPRE